MTDCLAERQGPVLVTIHFGEQRRLAAIAWCDETLRSPRDARAVRRKARRRR